MEELLGVLVIAFFVAILPLALMVGAFFAGSYQESRHLQSIREREAHFQHYPAVPTRSWDADRPVADARLVTASMVVSLDRFKRFLSRFRLLVGGNLRSYESLLERARREAVLRLKEQAPEGHIIVNLRLITSNIASIHDSRQQGVGGVEVLAFGTAVRYAGEPAGRSAGAT